MTTLLNKIKHGIFTFGETLECHPDFSPHLKEIVGIQNPVGHNLIEIITDELSQDLKRQMLESLHNSFGEPKAFSWNLNEWLLPREISRRGKILELEWEALEKNGIVDSVMLGIRDVTALRRIETDSRTNKFRSQLIGEIVDVGPEGMKRFFHSSEKFIKEISTLLENHPLDISVIFRDLHTIKGNARTLHLNAIALIAHNAENTCDERRKNPTLTPLLPRIKVELNDLKEIIAQYHQLYTRIYSNFSEVKSNKTMDNDLFQDLVIEIADQLKNTAKTLGKESPRIIFIGEVSQPLRLDRKLREVLRDCFIHLLGNCLDHGIENSSVRLAKGKPSQGTITIDTQQTNLITMGDDGAGIHLKTLRQLKTGKNDAPDLEIAESIFTSGISTSKNVTEISGRGVGMAAVKSFLETAGCSIGLRFTGGIEGDDHRSFVFEISLPQNSVKLRSHKTLSYDEDDSSQSQELEQS